MKIFSSQQMHSIDLATLKSQKISSLDLIERAATQVFNSIHGKLNGTDVAFHIFCGIGNNGGDGLVLSRLLIEHGYKVTTYIVNCSDKRSENFLKNYDRLVAMDIPWPLQLRSEKDFPKLEANDMVVDAIFGIGLNRPIVSWVINLIKYINSSNTFVLSIDIPSGLYADKAPDTKDGVIRAAVTFTFQTPKLVFFLPETANYTRDFEILDIGLDQKIIEESRAGAVLLSKNMILSMYQPREKFSHKGTYGHSLLVGGSYGKIGSMILATKAAMRVGSGLATAYIPECGYTALQTSVPTAMVITDDNDNYIEAINYTVNANAIGIGMGMGTHKKTIMAFGNLLKKINDPIVIDADALNSIASEKELANSIPADSILTPHPKELERLIGKWKDDFEKIEKAKQYSKRYKCILVIKGAFTLIINNDDVFINTTGNPGMATGGTGDVLTGMITGLLAQGYASLQAALIAVYLHGLAGDLSIQNTGYQGLLATDLVESIGKSFLKLFETKNSSNS
ncbi:NAD(P)H-hydrate dehydratase [Aquimarina sp. W85]|uniref:NAD(P)H-hydrate dehydratase n=1 Tax=Aquimarina rhodophyticola TaxID=3342246 RepID=UPI00366B73AE